MFFFLNKSRGIETPNRIGKPSAVRIGKEADAGAERDAVVLHQGRPGGISDFLLPSQVLHTRGESRWIRESGRTPVRAILFYYCDMPSRVGRRGNKYSFWLLRALMTHSSVPDKQREELGISNNLVRLSVGLEDPQDLIEDLDHALRSAVSLCFFSHFLNSFSARASLPQ